MDRKKTLLNVSISILFKIILVISALLSRRFLIKFIGNEANGINALYTSIIGVLSIADLGIGTAISFCMYKPITDNDNDKVAALYNFFTKIYKAIALIVFVVGLCFVPFLPGLAKGYDTSNYNLGFTFIIMLSSVVATYLFSANVSLINAYKNNYITTMVVSLATFIQDAFQIVLIYITRSFTVYIMCKLLCSILQWIVIKIIVKKMYSEIITKKTTLTKDEKKEVGKKIKAMFMHKIGTVLVNSIDSLIISAYIGVEILGKYSNYSVIMTSMLSILVLFFTPLTSIIGHMCTSGDIDNEKKYFEFFHKLNLCLGIIFFLGYYAIINDLISVLFGNGLEVTKDLIFVLTINYFVQFMRNAVLLFRDATGIFYNDRWKPLIEGIANVVLSIIFVELMGITGVILATIITNIFICHIIEPYVLYKNLFKESPKKYYIKSYCYCGFFAIILVLFNFVKLEISNDVISLLVNGCISVILSAVICGLFIFKDKNFKNSIRQLFKK